MTKPYKLILNYLQSTDSPFPSQAYFYQDCYNVLFWIHLPFIFALLLIYCRQESQNDIRNKQKTSLMYALGMTLNFWFFCFHFPCTRISGIHHAVSLFYTLLRIKPKALCRLNRHSTTEQVLQIYRCVNVIRLPFFGPKFSNGFLLLRMRHDYNPAPQSF